MKHYSCSSVTGYKDHLQTTDIRLPLKYPDTSETKLTPNEAFTNKLAHSGEILDFKNHPSFIDLVAVDVLNDMYHIALTPIVFESQLPLNLHKIVLNLPHKLVGSNCVSITVEHTPEDANLVIDFIDEKFLFVTVVVNLKDFVGIGHGFSVKDFKSWGNISAPYSFELKANPYYMKSIDGNNCIVSLQDGTLLHFQRSAPLEDINTFNFNEGKAPIGFFNKLFTGSNTTSKNCITDISVVNQNIVALTIDKTIKVYDLEAHDLVDSIKVGDDTFLSTVPNKYLTVTDQLILFHTTNSFESNESVSFVVWDLQFQKKGSIQIQTPSYSKWFVQDFTVSVSNTIELNILWKYNTSSTFSSYIVDSDTFKVIETRNSGVEESGDDFLQDFDQGYYKEKVLNSGEYSDVIIKTSVDIIRDRLDLPKTDDVLVQQTINKLSEQIDTEPWFMLNALCEEYSKLSKEALSLGVKNGTILTLQTNGVGIYRGLSYVEKFVDNNDKFNEILQSIDVKLSNKTIQKVYQYVLSTKRLTGESLSYISEEILNNKFNTDIKEISDILDNYPNVLEVISTLIDGPEYESVGFETNISVAEKLLYIVSFKNIIKVHKNLMIKLIILFSKFEDNEVLVDLSNKILQKFSDFKLFDILFTNNYEKAIIYHQILVKGDVINKYNYLNSQVKSQEYLVSIITRLVQLKQQDVVIRDLLDKIDVENNKFLIGLIYLTNKDPKSIPLLSYTNYQSFDKSTKLTAELNEFLSKDLKNGSDYYHELSSLISTSGIEFISEAVELELSAIDSLGKETAETPETAILKAKYYDNVFNLSLQSFDLNKLLLSLRNTQDSPNFKQQLTKLIKRLIEEKKFHTLSETQTTETTDFLSHTFTVIDLIVVELAEAEPIMKSIPFYEILYSWRINHQSKRSALEALYIFITRFEAQHKLDLNTTKIAYLKMLEFYLIILNGLKSYKSDKDKWLIRYGNKNKIITLKELSIEYSSYLNKINSL